jgi:Uma2 family endonuclease
MAESMLEVTVREIEAAAPVIAPVRQKVAQTQDALRPIPDQDGTDEVPEAFEDAFAGEPILPLYYIPVPDISHLITEDDTPVDNIFSEKQQRLLVAPLYSSWQSGRPFVAFANVGIYSSVSRPVIVPDAYLSLDVTMPEDVWAKEHRCYMLWEYGKPPEIVIEIVSNKKGGKNDVKLAEYARLGASFYAVYDPRQQIQSEPLIVYERRGDKFVRKVDAQFGDTGLGLVLWDGAFEGLKGKWLRWCDATGAVIPTGDERAKHEQQLAEQQRQRAERLAAQLKALNIEPEA